MLNIFESRIQHITRNLLVCSFIVSMQGVAKTAEEKTEPTISKDNIYYLMSQEILKTFSSTDRARPIELDADPIVIDQTDATKTSEALQDEMEKQLNMGEEKKRRRVLRLLAESHEANKSDVAHQAVLDTTSWQDLEILCGPISDFTHYLAASVDRTKTEFGRVKLYKKIIQPTATIDDLRAQRRFIQSLVANTKLLKDLNRYFDEIAQFEPAILSFWKDGIFQSQANITKLPGPLNAMWGVHQARDTSVDLGILTYLATPPVMCGVGVHMLNRGKTSLGTQLISMGALYGCMCVLLYPHVKNIFLARRCLQTKLIKVAGFMRTARSIVDLIKSKQLVDTLDVFEQLEFALIDLENHSEEMSTLFELLKTETFKGEASIFSLSGRVNAAYHLMTDLHEHFLPVLEALGDLDAQLSIARLFNEQKHKDIQYCFPKYLQDRQTPSIKAVDFWNPIISVDRVVANSLTLGHEYDVRQNIIVTGPNAGGKSTITRGLVVSLILAQSLGIAPAKELEFTPFSKITTYLNITDDIASGNSHFKAGVLRAREVLQTVLDCKDIGFSLSAIDEVFNGTPPREGQAAAYSLIKLLGAQEHNICITTTHFEYIPQLAQETGRFSNYKVTVAHDRGKLRFPYKLVPGISNQVITFQLLKEEGFDDEFIAYAQELLTRFA